MNIQQINVSDIKIAGYNPRKDLKPTDKEYKHIEKSISKFGQVEPLVWNKRSGYLVSGHQRFKILMADNPEEIKCSVVDLSEDDERALNIALNKIDGKWDDEKLAELLGELQALPDFDIETVGFTLDDLPSELHGGDDDFNTDGALDNIKEPITQPGDLIKLGPHRLLCADATDEEAVDRLMDGKRAAMIFTDPPYLMKFDGSIGDDGEKSHNASHDDIINDNLDEAEAGIFLSKIALTIKKHVKGAYYICFNRLQIEKVINSLHVNGMTYKSLIIWHKNHHNLSNSDYQSMYEPIVYGWVEDHEFYGRRGTVDFMVAKMEHDGTPSITMHGKSVYLKVGDGFWKLEKIKMSPKNYLPIEDGETVAFNLFTGENNVWKVDRTRKNDLHPTMKPLELCKKAIRNSSKAGEIVADFFLGSGSTLVSCEETGRICYGTELEPKYCDVIVERYASITGSYNGVRITTPDGIETKWDTNANNK